MTELREALEPRVWHLHDLYRLAQEMGLDRGRRDLVQDGQARWKRDVRNLLQSLRRSGNAMPVGDGFWLLRGQMTAPRLTLIWVPRPDLNLELITGRAERLLDYLDEPATLIVADPPFAIDYGEGSGSSSHNRPASQIVPGYIEIPAGEYGDFTAQWVRVAFEALGDHGSIYVVSGPTQSHKVRVALEDTGFNFINSAVWHRQGGMVTKRRWVFSHYDVLLYCKGDPDHPDRVFNFPSDVPCGKGGHPYGEDVWRVPLERHPNQLRYATMLPLPLAERMVVSGSNQGNLVVEPFLGGGPVAVACARHDRDYVGVDANPNAVWYTAHRTLLELDNGSPSQPGLFGNAWVSSHSH